MEEEKKEVKEKKGTDFTTLLCFSVIIIVTVGALLGFLSRNSRIEPKGNENTQVQESIVENDVNEDEAEEINEEDDYPYVDKEYVKKIINDYDSSKINYYDFSNKSTGSYAEYLVVENYNKVICIFSDRHYIKVFSIENGELKIHLTECLTDPVIGSVDMYEVEEKKNGAIIVFFEANAGDGLCYESSSLYRLDYDNKLVPIASYTCDSEEEERKRNLLDKNATDDEIAAQHTLKYLIDDEKVTKEEYEEYRQRLNNDNIVLFKTSERLNFFNSSKNDNNKIYKDMPYVFAKEKFDYEFVLVMPYVNLNSKDVQEVNKEINSIYEDEKKRANNKEYLGGLDYNYFIDSETNILCVEITRGAGVGESVLDTTRFYLDLETGKKLTNKEYLSKYNIDDKTIKQLSDKMIENYYNYYLKYLNDNNFDNISFEDFSKGLKVYNKKTEQKESYNYSNINDYEMDFDKDEKSFLIEKMSYEADGKTENIDGIWMWYHL